LVNLDNLSLPVSGLKNKKEDEFDKLEENKLKKDKQHFEIKEQEQRIEDMKTNREMRQKYATHIEYFMYSITVVILALVIADGFETFPLDCGGSCLWDLDTGVVIALVGSMAVAVIGLVGYIVRGLFK